MLLEFVIGQIPFGIYWLNKSFPRDFINV